jgi:phage-related protein
MKKVVFYTLANGRKPIFEYIRNLPVKQAEKIVFVLDLIETIEAVPRKFLKKLIGTDGIWEVRVRLGGNIFRLLGFLDGDNLRHPDLGRICYDTNS